MSLKKIALSELQALIEDFNLSQSRIGRDLFNDPSFIPRLTRENTRVTDTTLDKIFKYVKEKRGQLSLPLECANDKQKNKQ